MASPVDGADARNKRSVVGTMFGIFCKFILPMFVLSIAIIVGYFRQFPKPEAVFFATVFPLLKGHLPPPLFGHGRMEGTSTVPVPDDYRPQPRPDKERFLDLPGGYAMPQAGIGMCCRASAYDDELVYRTVLWYLLVGGRHIDGADLYLNHRAIGRGIQEAMRRGVPREQIFVTTKIWTRDFGYNATKATVPRFLEELDLEYIDLVLMHAPSHFFPSAMSNECDRRGISNKECRQETWKALSELRNAGIMRNVGVSNFFVKHLKDIEELQTSASSRGDDTVAPIANNQFMLNPFSPDFALETYRYCQDNGIAVTAYSSLGGALSHFSTATVNTLESLAAKYNTTVAQIALRWAIQKNVAVIPGTGSPSHMRENLAVYNIALSDDDMEALDGLRNDEQAKKFFYMEPLD